MYCTVMCSTIVLVFIFFLFYFQQKVSEDFIPDTKIVENMTGMGFHPEIINMSLRHACNNMNEAVEMLLRMQGDGTYENLLTSICGASSGATSSASSSLQAIASTSSPLSSVAAKLVENFKNSRLGDDIDALAV